MKYENKINNPIKKLIESNEMRTLRRNKGIFRKQLELKRKKQREYDPNYRIKQMERKSKILTPEETLAKEIRAKKHLNKGKSLNGNLGIVKTGKKGTLKLSSDKVLGKNRLSPMERIERTRENKEYKDERRKNGGHRINEGSSCEFYSNKENKMRVLYNGRDMDVMRFLKDAKTDTDMNLILSDLKKEMDGDKSFSGNLIQYIKKHYSGNDRVTDAIKLGKKITKTKDYKPKEKKDNINYKSRG